MPRPRFERASPELRERVLLAARREFAREGYQGASLNRILESAGLSKGAFYYYFDDKADLAATTLLQLFRPFVEGLEVPEQVATAKQFWAAVEALNRRQLDRLERSRDEMDLLTRLGAALLTNPELAQRVHPSTGEIRRKIVQLWRRGQELGAVRGDLPVEVLMAAMQGAKEGLARALLPLERALTSEELERLAALQWDLFRRMVEPRPKGIAPGSR